ncbi:MAG: LptF/LptG family permease [Pseudomonadota bacterium]
MRRLDRYIFRDLLGAFAFFVLIFSGVVWLTEAVRLIDTVVANAQSATVFLEFAVLVLPKVLSKTVPIAAFAATLYAVNRFNVGSELVVMKAAGQSPLAVLRPVAAFGLVAAMLTLLIHTQAVPQATAALEDRRKEIRTALANSLVREGQFIHPAKTLTIFVDDTSREGEMAGLFLHDARNPARPVTYSAERAILLRNGDEARLLMSKGIALTHDVARNTLSQVRFDEVTYDLTELVTADASRRKRPEEFALLDLVLRADTLPSLGRRGIGPYVAEGHAILVNTGLALLLPLLAATALYTGQFQRRGLGQRIVLGVGLGTLCVLAQILSKSTVASDPHLFGVLYSAWVLALVFGALLLVLSRPRRPRLRAHEAGL